MGERRAEHRFFRPDVASDVADELASHLEMRERDLEREGLPAPDAKDAAARRFGNVAAVARECRAIDEAWYREQRRASMFMDLRQDVSYALRTLRRSPSFTVVAVVTLALGIGATTGIFSLANWALLRPVPGVEGPAELQQIWSGTRGSETSFSPSFLSYPNLQDMVPRLQTISIAGLTTGTLNIGQGTAPAQGVRASFSTASYFEVLGVRMRAGRPFTASEDVPGRSASVVVASERFARLRFGSADAAIGQPLQVNGLTFTIIGVAGRGFAGTERLTASDVWLPGTSNPVVNYMPTLRYEDRQRGGFYDFVARLKPGASWAQADAELKSMAAWLAAEHPKENAKYARVGFHLMGPIGAEPLGGYQKTRGFMLLMLGVSALVLLIACSNVASLLMMRGIGRGGEVAVRQALGAGRWRLVRQHLTEGTLLWTLGGAVAVTLVWVLLRSANGAALLGQRGGAADGVPLDWRVVLFATALSLLVGLLFSVMPALRAVRVSTADMLRQGGPSSTMRNLRAGTALTVLQLALSLTLVVGALLLAATVRQLSRVDLGFDAKNLYTFHIRPRSGGYTPVQAAAYRDEFARQLSLVPGVEGVAISLRAPFAGSAMGTRVKIDGSKEIFQPQATELLSVNYFETLRIPLLRGRLFSSEDLGGNGTAPRLVVVVSEAFARRMFGSGEPIGRTIEYNTIRAGKRFEVIGVVGNVRTGSLVEEAEPMVYEPAESALPFTTFVVRAVDTDAAASAVARIAASLNPALPVILPMSMTDAIGRARAEWDTLARLMTGLAAIAGVLAAVGLYGVVAFGVASRRREFGIRLALGASPSRVMALVLRRTAIIAALGLALGAAGAIVLARVLSSRLFGVTPFDPAVWTAAAFVLITMAALASWIPARRAVSVEVTRSLRAL